MMTIVIQIGLRWLVTIPSTFQLLKGLSHGILSYFDHRQNYLEIEGNLKIILYKDGKKQRDNNQP